MQPLPHTTHALKMTYRIGRGEQGVLTFEPYKSFLLPHWRFRSVSIALESATHLWGEFNRFYEADDFVGMDMSRKFIQMGMTRAKRYANYKGGRKYVDGEGDDAVGRKRRARQKSEGHEGKREKEEASNVFRGYWDRCREHEGYARLKEEFVREQKEWMKKHDGADEEEEESENGNKSGSRNQKRKEKENKNG